MRPMLFAIVLLHVSQFGCRSDALEPKAKQYRSAQTAPGKKPAAFLFDSSINLSGTAVSVDFVALRATLLEEANKLYDPLTQGAADCGQSSWSLFATTFFNFSQVFLLKDNVYEHEDDTVCEGNICSFSSAPPDFSDKGWQDFLSEMLRRLSKAGVNVLSADKLSVDPLKVARYLAGQ